MIQLTISRIQEFVAAAGSARLTGNSCSLARTQTVGKSPISKLAGRNFIVETFYIAALQEKRSKNFLGDIAMTSEPNNLDTSVRIEIIPQSGQISSQTSDMVENEMAGESEDLKSETKALIDALKKRAQSEAQNAGTLTREAYLNAVRKARETLEQNQLIERDRIEHSFELIKKEAEKNWESVVKEVAEIGDRLADAAKAAWDALTAPRPRV